jgi:hypothetical protein
MSEFEPLLTEQDAAKVLNVHRGTLNHWRSKGYKDGPPWVAVGEAIRYAPEALRRYVEARTRQAASSSVEAA